MRLISFIIVTGFWACGAPARAADQVDLDEALAFYDQHARCVANLKQPTAVGGTAVMLGMGYANPGSLVAMLTSGAPDRINLELIKFVEHDGGLGPHQQQMIRSWINSVFEMGLPADQRGNDQVSREPAPGGTLFKGKLEIEVGRVDRAAFGKLVAGLLDAHEAMRARLLQSFDF